MHTSWHIQMCSECLLNRFLQPTLIAHLGIFLFKQMCSECWLQEPIQQTLTVNLHTLLQDTYKVTTYNTQIWLIW